MKSIKKYKKYSTQYLMKKLLVKLIKIYHLDNSYSKFHCAFQALLKIYMRAMSRRNQYKARLLMTLKDAEWNKMLSLKHS